MRFKNHRNIELNKQQIGTSEVRTMTVAKPNFSAKIHFTVGIKKSAAITKVEENWLSSLEHCDVIESDLLDEGAVTFLECVGIDLDLTGSFVVDVLGVAKYEESPDYEITNLETVLEENGHYYRPSTTENCHDDLIEHSS